MDSRKTGAVTIAAIAAIAMGGCSFRGTPAQVEPTQIPAVQAQRVGEESERITIAVPLLEAEIYAEPAGPEALEYCPNAINQVAAVYLPYDHGSAELEQGTEPEAPCGCPEDFTVSQDAEQPGPTLTYLGSFQVYGYDLGKTDGITASGTQATVGRTVAAKGIPYGTRLYIEGIGERVVEDTGGMAAGVIDVLCNNHSECYAITGKYDVYIIEAAEQSETAPGVAAPEAVTK